MRKAIVSNMMSLDGYLEGAKRELDWHVVDEEFFAYAAEMLNSVDTILFGRRTYEMMAAYWPQAAADAIAEKMNGLPKVVFSRSLKSADWAHTTVLRGEAQKHVQALKQAPGGDMVILGSGALASSLLEAGLIDEYRVILNPVVLGAGRSLFQGMRERVRLRLRRVRPFRSGVVLLAYEPA